MPKYRYYYNNKASIKANVDSFSAMLNEIMAEETDLMLKYNLLEVEGENTISVPPAFTKIVQLIKLINDFDGLVEQDSLLLLKEKQSEGE